MPDETKRNSDLVQFDRAIAEHEARQLADEIGYSFGVLTDGTIVLEPPADPNCCDVCAGAPLAEGFKQLGHMSEDQDPADRCHDCGVELGPLSRCQIPAWEAGAPTLLVYVCQRHYDERAAGWPR